MPQSLWWRLRGRRPTSDLDAFVSGQPQPPEGRQETNMASDLIRSTYRRVWWALMLRGLFAIALGTLVLWRPLDSIASFALVIAFWALFTGFVEILHALELR